MARKGSYPKGIAKRDEILVTALEVIARHGYHGTSLREIAEATTLTQAGLLYYFETKENLFTEILRKRDEVDIEHFDDSDGLSPRIIRIARHNVQVPGLVQLYSSLANAATDPAHPAHSYFRDRYAKIRENVAGEIRRQQSSGRFSQDLDAERLASLVIAAADGMQEQWMLNPNLDMAEHLEYLWSILGSVPTRAAEA